MNIRDEMLERLALEEMGLVGEDAELAAAVEKLRERYATNSDSFLLDELLEIAYMAGLDRGGY